jgi:hypothetical protein
MSQIPFPELEKDVIGFALINTLSEDPPPPAKIAVRQSYRAELAASRRVPCSLKSEERQKLTMFAPPGSGLKSTFDAKVPVGRLEDGSVMKVPIVHSSCWDR